jgi:single-strand DNA-binding protein
LNKVYLLGSLTREPESRETHSGSTVVRAIVAVSRDYFSKERNQRVRETDAIEVQAWGHLGAQLASQAHKNSALFVEGRLKVDSWETPTGERRQRLVVHLESFAVVAPGQRVAMLAPAAGAAGAAVATGSPEGGEEVVEEAGEGAPAGAGPGASGRRKRRRRRGPRRDGIPAGPAAPVTPEDRAAFSAGISEPGAATSPTPASEVPPPAPEAPAASAPPEPASPPPPPPPPAAPPPPPVERKPVPNVSLKEDMPF